MWSNDGFGLGVSPIYSLPNFSAPPRLFERVAASQASQRRCKSCKFLPSFLPVAYMSIAFISFATTDDGGEEQYSLSLSHSPSPLLPLLLSLPLSPSLTRIRVFFQAARPPPARPLASPPASSPPPVELYFRAVGNLSIPITHREKL